MPILRADIVPLDVAVDRGRMHSELLPMLPDSQVAIARQANSTIALVAPPSSTSGLVSARQEVSCQADAKPKVFQFVPSPAVRVSFHSPFANLFTGMDENWDQHREVAGIT